MPWPTARRPRPSSACSSPANSCSLANFFVGDPDLPPGGRPRPSRRACRAAASGARMPACATASACSRIQSRRRHCHGEDSLEAAWVARASSPTSALTRRQGLEADLQYIDERWRVSLHYALVECDLPVGVRGVVEGLNPAADANGNITVQPGNHLPGIPCIQFKASAYYNVTDKWTVGVAPRAAGRERPVPLRRRRQIWSPRCQATSPWAPARDTSCCPTWNSSAWAKRTHITNANYYTFGTFSPTSSVFIAQAPGASLTQSYSPAAPFAIFGGLRAKF